ncbi:MAG: hypothetical protein WBZ05_01680 [Desulfobacterales bacterium]
MKKWIYIGIGAIVVVIAIIIFGLSNLGPIIKQAVNSYGPKITKTKLHVDDVGISIFSGEAKIKQFFLGNPAGFKTPSAMKVGSVLVNVDEKSLTSNTIIIDRIEVITPEITYEKIGKNDNFNAILKNITKTSDSQKRSKETSEKEGAGKKLIIRNFIVKDGKVNLDLSVYGIKDKQQISVPLPNIHLKDIGTKKNGASPSEAFKEIFAALYGKITSPAVTDVLNKQLTSIGVNLDSLGEDAIKKLGDTIGKEEGLNDIGKKVKGMFGN